MAADLFRQCQAVHLGHLHVEDGDVERVAPSDVLERVAGRCRLLRQHPPRLGLPPEDLAVGRVVVHDQHPLPRDLGDGLELLGRQWACRGLGPDREVERGTLPDPALHPHPPAHLLCQALADREAQARAAVTARGRGVDLRERLEQPVHPVLRDPDPGIPDREVDRIPLGASVGRGLDGRGIYPQDNLSLIGELHRVVQQVEEDLP